MVHLIERGPRMREKGELAKIGAKEILQVNI